ncbi:hypothetical protein Tco_0430951 [Tanacetum coccineum]
MSNRHQELASPEQTASGKDFLNMLMLIVFQKLYGSQLTMLHSKELGSPKKTALALAIPEQMATGKETSNPFMAERKYPLIKETLDRMMYLKLIAESTSDGAYDLLKFIQKQIDEAGSHDRGKKNL